LIADPGRGLKDTGTWAGFVSSDFFFICETSSTFLRALISFGYLYSLINSFCQCAPSSHIGVVTSLMLLAEIIL